MGAEVGKCVCAPDPKEIDSESNVNYISGEKDVPDNSESSSTNSSSEGDSDHSSSSSESDDHSSSSHHHKTHRRKHKKDKKKKHKTHSKRYKKKPRKHHRKKKRKRHRKHEESSSSESYTTGSSSSSSSSDDDRSETDSNEDNRTMIEHNTPPSHQIVRGRSREYRMTKKLQKEQDRVKRKLKVIEKQRERRKMLEQQKQTYSYHHIDDHGTFVPLQPIERINSFPSLSHPNLQIHGGFVDSISDQGSLDSRSIASIHSEQLPDTMVHRGKHPRILSMVDTNTIQLLSNQNVQEILNPAPDFRQNTGFRIDVNKANSMYNENRSQPAVSPHSQPIGLVQPQHAYTHSLTPTTHQYYNNNQNTHKYSQSVDVQSFPNVQGFERRWSSPSSNMNNIVFGQQPAPIHKISIVDDVKDVSDDLPPDMAPNVVRSNSAPNQTNIFDMSSAGFRTMFPDNVEVVEHTPPSTKPRSITMYTDMQQSNAVDESNISPKPSSNGNSATPPIEITVNNLNELFVNKDLKIHGQDPHAVPPSPPIESVYKPLDHKIGILNSGLSKISESATPHTSISTNNSLQQPVSNMTTTSSNESNNMVLSVINMNDTNTHYLSEIKPREVLSSPDNDDDRVAQLWKNLHKFDIPDDKIPDASEELALFNIKSDLSSNIKSDLSSSDDEIARHEVDIWRQKVENVSTGDILAPQSSDDDAVGDKRNDDADDDADDDNNNDSNHSNQAQVHSTYSTESHQSSDYNDVETSTDPDLQNVTVSHKKRHSHLLRKESFRNWQPSDVTDLQKDMQKHYDHMEKMELEAMRQRVDDLQDEEDQSKSNWIVQ